MPFEYPNLLMGTRSAKGWTINGVSEAASVNSSGGIIRSNTRSSENFIFSPSVVLNKGIDYTLHCFAANTPNLISTGAWVLDDAGYSDSYAWIGACLSLNKPGPGGGVARCHVPPQCQRTGRREVQNSLRQRRECGREGMFHLVPRRHAHRGHGASCMGAGEWGGVA